MTIKYTKQLELLVHSFLQFKTLMINDIIGFVSASILAPKEQAMSSTGVTSVTFKVSVVHSSPGEKETLRRHFQIENISFT